MLVATKQSIWNAKTCAAYFSSSDKEKRQFSIAGGSFVHTKASYMIKIINFSTMSNVLKHFGWYKLRRIHPVGMSWFSPLHSINVLLKYLLMYWSRITFIWLNNIPRTWKDLPFVIICYFLTHLLTFLCFSPYKSLFPRILRGHYICAHWAPDWYNPDQCYLRDKAGDWMVKLWVKAMKAPRECEL